MMNTPAPTDRQDDSAGDKALELLRRMFGQLHQLSK